MDRENKLGIVLTGYVLAFVISIFMTALADRQFSPEDNQEMGGMIAGGEVMYGGAVFVLASLALTGLGLWFLRPNRRFWSAFSSAGLWFAIVGLAAVLAGPATTGVAPPESLLVFVGVGLIVPIVHLLGLLQMLGSPLWILSFALFAAVAPAPDLRRRMLAALVIEFAIAAYGVIHFLMPQPRI